MCIFCKIINKEIPSNIVYEDDELIAFHDISPQAPVHILIVPKEHIASANDLDEKNCAVVAKVFALAKKLAKEQGVSEGGYRIVNNCGENGGQTVFHIHFHLIGGKKLNVNMA